MESSLNQSAMYEQRTKLPFLKDPKKKFSVWKILKDSIGKDLSKIAVPVQFNEPIGMLQKIAEIMEYESLLKKANEEEDPALRQIYVAVFILSQYKCTKYRLNKPFNPILGETYELIDPNFRFIAEQVSHHPPISASYGQGANNEYVYWNNTNVKTNFWGASIEVVSIGLSHVRLPRTNEMFSIKRPSTVVHNLILGEMYLEHTG